jgi:putative two-component system response regulator
MVKTLIVDDLPDNSRLLAHLVKDQGYEASVASNGRQALEIALVERPDVILLDVMMPGMDGIEVCRRLKADEKLRNIPVILVTAKGLDKDVVRGLDVGADDYVTRPFNREVLAARLRSAIRLKQSCDAVMRTNEELQRKVKRRIQTESDLHALRRHRGAFFKSTTPRSGPCRIRRTRDASQQVVHVVPCWYQLSLDMNIVCRHSGRP